MSKSNILIPKRTVIEMTSLSATTIWREVKAGRFPKSVKIGPNRVAWRMSDIDSWIATKIKGEI